MKISVSAKRARLLATAERLFDAEGFHATGIDRIVAEAGVVRMTLYKHFASKEALIAAVLRARHDRFMAAVDAATAAAEPGAVTLALVDAHGRWLAGESPNGCFMVKAMGEFAAHAPAVHAAAVQAKQDLLDRLAAALERDGLGGEATLARRLLLVLEGGTIAVPVTGVDATLADTRALATRLLDDAAATPG
mgnify:FL=1